MPDKVRELQARLVEAQLAEREDTLGYLARKQAAAEAVAARMTGELKEKAEWAARQCAVIADEIRVGLHVGEVAVASALAAGDQG